MKRYFCVLILGATLLGSAAFADDKHHNKRYYDRDHKDYHEWNEQENRAYHQYIEENRRTYHDWAKANKREQQAYWRWRHDHMQAERR